MSSGMLLPQEFALVGPFAAMGITAEERAKLDNVLAHIELYRRRTGARQEDVAKDLGMSQGQLSRLLGKSRGQKLTVVYALRISAGLGLSIVELLQPPQPWESVSGPLAPREAATGAHSRRPKASGHP